MIDVAVIVLRERRSIALLTAALSIIVGLVTIFAPRTYSAAASFAPAMAEGSLSRAGGLAAQFGISLAGISGGQSPDFYMELLQGQRLLGRVVEHEYQFERRVGLFSDEEESVSGSLLDILEIEESTAERRRDEGIEQFREQMSVTTAPLSGTVSLRVRTDWPQLSKLIVERMLELVDDFNRTQRQSQARAERIFVESRLVTAREELEEAENASRAFLERNRTFASSPQLQFEFDRLERDVGLRQQVFMSLTQAFEQSRIDEVRNTPVITVVQAPVLPGLPNRRRLVMKVLIAMIIGLSLGVVLAVVRDSARQSTSTDPERRAELEDLRKEAMRDFRRPWRLLRRTDN